MSQNRSTEDQIRSLCQKLIDAGESQDFEALAAELRSTLTKHINQIRTTVQEYPRADKKRPTDR